MNDELLHDVACRLKEIRDMAKAMCADPMDAGEVKRMAVTIFNDAGTALKQVNSMRSGRGAEDNLGRS